ncbi:MAG: cold shock domain-containing protein, partial [Cyanobacteria bacterium J06643_4]
KTVDTETFPTKTGVVKLLFVLKPGNFHGYIAPDDGTKDILFHQKYINADIFDRLERGTKVVATIKHIENKVYATRVDLAS